MRIGIKPDGKGFEELVSACAAAEEAGFDLISRWDHVSAEGFGGLDAVVIMTGVAATTTRVGIAFHVLNVTLRNPVLLASQLAALQSFSKGRLEAGLGAGGPTAFVRPDHEMTGVSIPPFAQRVKRLEMCCQLLPRLWRGEEVTEPTLGIENASLGELNIDSPPIVVGGITDSILEVAARFADGWNANVMDPRQFEELGRRIDHIRASSGRQGRFDKQVQLLPSMYAPKSLREFLKRFEDAGASTAILGPWVAGVVGVHRLAEAVL